MLRVACLLNMRCFHRFLLRDEARLQRAFPVSILQVMFLPTRPSACRVTSALSGRSRYCAFRGACSDLSSLAVMATVARDLSGVAGMKCGSGLGAATPRGH